MTARVAKRAVAINEINSNRLKVQTWDKQVLPSSIIKINKGDCFFTPMFR